MNAENQPADSDPADEALQSPRKPTTAPTGETVQADESDASVGPRADRQPTPEEEAAAPTEVDEKVAERYEEALDRGANAKGEGRITPD